MADTKAGAWVFNPVCLDKEMPQKIATGFAQALDGFTGGKLTPYLYCGTQLVNGTNHMLICMHSDVRDPSERKMVKVVLHETIDPVIGKFTLIQLEDI